MRTEAELKMSNQKPIATLSCLLSITLVSTVACKPLEGDEYRELSAKRSISWDQLKVGQKFRMNPPDQMSKCYLPKERGLTLGNCGDQEYWIVIKAYNPYIKQVKSLINNKCLAFDGGNLIAADCTNDFKQPPSNSWGDENLSPLHKQYLSVQGNSLVPAFFRDCSSVTGSRMRSGGKCTVVANSSKRAGRSDPVALSVDDGYGSADSRLIDRSKIIRAKDEPFSGSFASEIKWGHIPRITAIYVATNDAHQGATSNRYISGIQILHADGSKQLFGSCAKDERDICKVNSTDHPGYPNPKLLNKDEYITDIGMKFGEGNHKDGSTKLIEVMIKTNKHSQKNMLWKGLGDGKSNWQWLSSEKNTIIAGFFGTFHNPGYFPHHMIRSMGVIYANVQAYRAHHPEIFQSPQSRKIPALAEKDGRNLIGATQGNSTFNSRPILASAPVKTMDESLHKAERAFEQVFQDPAYQFSSTFYASAMGNSASTSSLRMYFKDSILAAIVVHPNGVGGVIQPEVYGTIPEGQSPDLYLELGAHEYISRINWQVFKNPPWGEPGHRSVSIQGPLIYGIQVITNKGRSAIHSSFVESRPWQYAMGKDGYAIVGFHGSISDGEAAENLRLGGIINLGAWLVKESELPNGVQKVNHNRTKSTTFECPARTFRKQSDHSFVEFRLPSSSQGKTKRITVNSGAHNKYGSAKCNRVWWSDLTFVCQNRVWTREGGDWGADGLCHGSYNGASPFVHLGDF